MNKDFGYGMGYELETYGIILKKASALIPNSSLYTKESHEYLDYSKYNITNEIDLTDELLCGGEIISPIIYNEIELEKSIKLVLDVLALFLITLPNLFLISFIFIFKSL